MTQAPIRKLVADNVATALEAQTANVANADNTNRNTKPREAHVARKCSYKDFMSCQPFNFKGTKGAVGLIRWFEGTESVFSRSNYTEDCKVKFATGTLTEEALSWWNSFAQPIGIEEAYEITWSELKKLLIKKYCPQTEFSLEDYPKVLKGMLPLQSLKLWRKPLPQLRGANKSFISISLASMLNILPITIDVIYDIEMVNGNLVSTNTIIQGCTLTLLNQHFKIDLMVIKLGIFDIVIGMDWLSKYHAKILYDEKVVHIPIDGETLIIRGDRRAAPVARAPYRLAPLEMHELSNQLQELADREKQEVNMGEDQEPAFQLLKRKLCEAPILALPEGTMILLFTVMHHSKANVVADALSRKERIKLLRVRALVMTLHAKLPSQILEAQNEAMKEKKVGAENLRGLDKAFEVSPRKGVIRFKKQGKLNPRYIGPYKILDRIGLVAYKLELPEELSNVHNTFYGSKLKKCLSNESLAIPMKELLLDDKLNFVEEPVEIMDREVKQLK
nr:reverse transcriptase domain-containing protein [Tanacetum cinerariifolium]